MMATDLKLVTDYDQGRIKLLQDMIAAREKKLEINTKEVKYCEEKVLKILNATRLFMREELEPGQYEASTPVKPYIPEPLSPSEPGRFVIRETHHLRPNSSFATEFEFPLRDNLSFENPIVGFKTGKWPNGYYGWNFILKDGTKSAQSQRPEAQEIMLESSEIHIRKFSLQVDRDAELTAIRLYDENNELKLEAGKDANCDWFHIILRPNERVLGIKAACFNQTEGRLQDPIFVIGRLE